MTEVIRNNVQLWGIMLLWVLSGIYGGPAAYGVVMLSIVLFWRRGMYAELLLGFWFILIMSDSLEYQMAWAKTLKNLYIVALAGILIVDRKQFAPFNGIYKKFIPFFIVAIVALINSPVMTDAMQRTLSYVLIFLVAPNYITIAFRERGAHVFKDILYLAMAILLVGLLLRFVMPEVAISHGDRFRGVFGNPNGLGLFMIVVFVLFYVVDELYQLFTRNERILFYLLLGASLFLSGSRNALISITLFLLFARVFRMSFGIGLISILVVFMAYQVISANLFTIIHALGLEEFLRIESLESGSGRLIAWQFAWTTIQDNVLLGRGFSFDLHLMRSNFDWLSRAGHEGGVHNSYLILWLNTGLIGVVLYFRAFFLLFVKAAKKHHLAVPSMVAVLFSVSFEPWLAASLNPYTIIFLIFLTIFTEDIFLPVEDKDESGLILGEEGKTDTETGDEGDVLLNGI